MQKTKTTNRKFYGKWLYKVSVRVPGVAVLRSKSPRDAIQSLNADDSEAFDCLGVLTSGAYFLNPEVKKLIGYPGQVPSPANDDIDSYSEMLAQVVERGPVFRPTVK